MKSKTSFFNRTLFASLLKRYWPIFAIYGIIWLIVLPISLANMLKYSSNPAFYGGNMQLLIAGTGNQILSVGLYGGVIMSGVAAAMIAMAAFNYLYSARSVSMICALPIRREGVFVSVFSSGLTGLLAINLAVFLITLAVTAAYGVLGACLGYVLQWLAMVCLMNLFFFGFATLCASFTGHILVLPIVYAVLNLTVMVVEYLVRLLGSMFIYGLSASGGFSFLSLSPAAYLITQTRVGSITVPDASGGYMTTGYFYDGWLAIIIYAAVGLVFAALAMFIIRRRRMESAGDVVAVRSLKPIFKYCLSGGCALVFGMLIYTTVFSGARDLYGLTSMLYMLLFMLFGAFVGYFAAEMLLLKTLHVFSGRNWARMGVTALVIAALMFCGEFDLFGIERKLPDAAQIENVSIMSSGESVVFEDPANIAAVIALQSDIISHKDINEAQTGNYDAYVTQVRIGYSYKNGGYLSRNYVVYRDVSDDIYTLNEIMNWAEAVEYRKRLSVPVTMDTISDAYLSYFDKTLGGYTSLELSADQAYELYTTCVLPDIDDGSLGKVWLVANDEYYSAVYDCTFNLVVEQRLKDNDYKSDYFYTTLTTKATRTNAWVREQLGLELCTMGESQAILQRQEGSDPGAKAMTEKAAAYVG